MRALNHSAAEMTLCLVPQVGCGFTHAGIISILLALFTLRKTGLNGEFLGRVFEGTVKAQVPFPACRPGSKVDITERVLVSPESLSGSHSAPVIPLPWQLILMSSAGWFSTEE